MGASVNLISACRIVNSPVTETSLKRQVRIARVCPPYIQNPMKYMAQHNSMKA
jgi:hypothetical protein